MRTFRPEQSIASKHPAQKTHCNVRPISPPLLNESTLSLLNGGRDAKSSENPSRILLGTKHVATMAAWRLICRPVNPTRMGVALASWFVLCAEPGLAQILLPGASLEVHGAASLEHCVAEDELGAKVRAQLSKSTTADSAAEPRTISIDVSGAPEGLVAEVRVVGRSPGVRRIRARQCAGLTDALAVTIALILDPNANITAITDTTAARVEADAAARTPELPTRDTRGASAQHKRPPTGTPPTSDDAVAPRQPAHDDPSASHLEWRAWAGFGAGSWAPWQIEAGAAMFSDAWGFELGAFYQTAHEHSVGNGKVRLAALGGLAAGCLQSGSSWRTMLCLRGLAGAERARGVGFDRDDTALLTTVSLGPSLGIENGSRLRWGLYLTGQAVVLRDKYVLENDPSALAAPPIAAWLFVRVTLSSCPGRR